MNKVFLLSLLLPISFSLQAVSSASIAKLGGAAVAGVVSLYSAYMAKDAYGNGKKPSDVFFAAPWAMASVFSGIVAAVAVKSALEIDMDFAIKSVKIK